MKKLPLSIAIGNYDRVRALMDGTVRIDGVDPIFMALEPEEIFFRAFRGVQFDVCELSLSSFAVKTANGDNPYVGVPVFPSRMFRHSGFYIHKGRGISVPEDLRGRRIGLPEYQLTACVWCRLILEQEYGVKPQEIRWVRGGIAHAGRVEKIDLNLSNGVAVENIPPGRTISQMLAAGEIDGVVGPRAPLGFDQGDPNIGWLFKDPQAAARDYFRRKNIFPIMHLLGVRREIVEQQPWLPVALLKAFTQAKDLALAALNFTAALQVSLPFTIEAAREANELIGRDFWSYGLDGNWHVLETFLNHHHAEGLSARLVTPEELFHPSTLENFRI